MPFTEFTCRSGGSNLYAGTLDGSAEAATTPLVSYANGNWNSGTGVFTPVSGNPVAAGVTTSHYVSIVPDNGSLATVRATNANAGASSTISASMPATVLAGDTLLMIATQANTGTFTTPTGWTLYNSYLGNFLKTYVFTKSAVGTEAGTSVTFASTISDDYATTTYCFAGAVSIDAAASNIQNTTLSSCTCPTVTPGTSAGRFLISAYTVGGNGFSNIVATPAGQTTTTKVSSNTLNYATIQTGYEILTSGAATGTRVATPLSVSSNSIGLNLVIAGIPQTGFVAAVTAVSTTTITLSLTRKAGVIPITGTTGYTANVGGAWAGPNGSIQFPFQFISSSLTDASGNPPRVNFKNGVTYSITAGMTHGTTAPVWFQGYTTTFGDGGRATFDGGTVGASYNLLTLTNTGTLADVILQNNGVTGSADGLTVTGKCYLRRVVVNSVRGRGFVANTNGGSSFVECEAYLCNASNTANYGGFALANTGSIFKRCISHDNAGANSAGFHFGFGGSLVDCIADTNGGHGVNVNASNSTVSLKACRIYNNTGSGISLGTTQTGIVLDAEDVILSNNGAYGLTNAATLATFSMINCAFRSNTSGTVNAGVSANVQIGAVTLTGDPYTDAPNGNFNLNNTAGAGAACRGAGIGTYSQTQASYTGTVSYPDIGAGQHLETAGGSTFVGITSIRNRFRQSVVFRNRPFLSQTSNTFFLPTIRTRQTIVRQTVRRSFPFPSPGPAIPVVSSRVRVRTLPAVLRSRMILLAIQGNTVILPVPSRRVSMPIRYPHKVRVTGVFPVVTNQTVLVSSRRMVR